MKTYDYETGMSVMQGIMDYENGEMDNVEVLDFFQHLVNTGIINHLQGSYQRTASQLLEAGMIEHPFPFDVKEAE
jgi:hypothetical protein